MRALKMKSSVVGLVVATALSLSAVAAPTQAPLKKPDQIGLKNFRAILASLEEATGISSRNANVQATYRKVSTRLPVTGAIGELGSPTVLALVELSGTFCKELITQESSQSPADRRFFLFVDFTKGQDQFTTAAWSQIVNDLATAFWQRSPTKDEMANFNQLLSDYVKEEKSPTGTQQTLQAACVQAGSSLAFLTNGI